MWVGMVVWVWGVCVVVEGEGLGCVHVCGVHVAVGVMEELVACGVLQGRTCHQRAPTGRLMTTFDSRSFS